MTDAGNAPKLRDENLQIHKENLKIQKELAECRKALESSEFRLKAQSEKDGSIIRDLENTLRDCLEEITEIDKHILGMLCSFSLFLHICVFSYLLPF